MNLEALRKEISIEISKAVDEFVSTLKQQLLNPSSNISSSTGIADKVKNWWYSILYGREGKDNPYKNMNKYGNLGIEETRLTLKEYSELKALSLELENQILNENSGNLALVKIIDNWGKNLKKHLDGIVQARLNVPSNQASLASNVDPKNYGSQQNVYANNPDYSKFQTNVHSSNPDYSKLKNPAENPISGSGEATWSKDSDVKSGSPGVTEPAMPSNFENLSDEQKKHWNNIGGGDSNEFYFKRKSWGKLPWILRKGDPRIDQLKNDKGNHTFNKLKNQNRIEGIGLTINSEEDLQKAVESAKNKSNEHSNKRWSEKKQKLNQLIDAAITSTNDSSKKEVLNALKDEMDLRHIEKTLKDMGFINKNNKSATSQMRVSPELQKTIPPDIISSEPSNKPEYSEDDFKNDPAGNRDYDSNLYNLLSDIPSEPLEIKQHAKKIYDLIGKSDVSPITSFLGYDTDDEAKEDIKQHIKNLKNDPVQLKDYLSHLNPNDKMSFESTESTTEQIKRYYKFMLEHRS